MEPKITRVEFITPEGREKVYRGKNLKVENSVQDDGRTIKIFVSEISELVSGENKNPFQSHIVNEKLIGRTCMEKNCLGQAEKDYNGHGHLVCGYHYKKLNDHFDNEYQ